MIEFKHVNKKYPNGFEALKDIDLTIGQGEFVAIIGLSGAGGRSWGRLLLFRPFRRRQIHADPHHQPHA